MDPIELSDDEDFAPMPVRQGPKKVRVASFRRAHSAHSRTKKPSLKSLESRMSDEQYRNLFGSDSSDVEDDNSDEEDGSLRDLKRPKHMSSDEVLQAAGKANAHQSLVTLLSSSETLLKEISSEKAENATEKADNAKKAGVITKLTKEVAELKKQCKKVTDERDKARKEAKKAIAAPTVSSTSAPSHELVTAYDELIKAVKVAYTQKLQAQKSSSSAPLPFTVTQKNTNPQYLTERYIECKTTATGVAADGFYFDLGPSAGGWVQITDSAVVTALQSLGQMQGTAFVLTPGASCQYLFGGHSYDAFVSSNVAVDDNVAVVFNSSFVPMNAALFAKIKALQMSDIKDWKVLSKHLVELAELFSSLGGHNFKSQSVADVAEAGSLSYLDSDCGTPQVHTDAILLMHGSGPYDGLFNDPAGYDVSKSALNNAMGVDMYQSKTDHIPIEYNTDQTTHQKKGSGLLGLLLRKQNAPVHVYEDYSLGNQCLPDPFKRHKNGIVIRDQSLYLPLGLVVAK